MSQCELGRFDDALASVEESIGIYRRLARAHPERHDSDVALSLNNLGVLQSELGLLSHAVASSSEAVEICRRLARQRPDRFEPDLATWLGNLSRRQLEVGLESEAVASGAEALAILARHYAARPGTHAAVAQILVQNYLRACRAAGVEPVASVLEPYP